MLGLVSTPVKGATWFSLKVFRYQGGYFAGNAVEIILINPARQTNVGNILTAQLGLRDDLPIKPIGLIAWPKSAECGNEQQQHYPVSMGPCHQLEPRVSLVGTWRKLAKAYPGSSPGSSIACMLEVHRAMTPRQPTSAATRPLGKLSTFSGVIITPSDW